MAFETIQWFPGHMAKTRRMIRENIGNVDLVLELLDARIPLSSRNPEIVKLTSGKPTLLLMNKASLADPGLSKTWINFYTSETTFPILIDCITGEGINRLAPAIQRILSEKLSRYAEKGMAGRRIRAMVLGIPNVGKSSLINRICGNKKTRVEDRPGVTRDKQWVPTGIGVDLLDMPGILWPKFDDQTVGENLALTGAIKDDILDTEGLAIILCKRLRSFYPRLLADRYKLSDADLQSEPYELFRKIGKKRGFLIRGGEIDSERTSAMLLDEFRGAKIGRITLDQPTLEDK